MLTTEQRAQQAKEELHRRVTQRFSDRYPLVPVDQRNKHIDDIIAYGVFAIDAIGRLQMRDGARLAAAGLGFMIEDSHIEKRENKERELCALEGVPYRDPNAAPEPRATITDDEFRAMIEVLL